MLHNDNFTVHESIEAYFGHVINDVGIQYAALKCPIRLLFLYYSTGMLCDSNLNS